MTCKPGWTQVFSNQQSNQHDNWCWIPGWSFSGSVFSELFNQLPGNHWVADYRTASLNMNEMSELLAQELPDQANLIGWSLGGVLAMKVADITPVRSVVTLATSQHFIAAVDNEAAGGMPDDTFSAFSQSLISQPEKTLKRFIGLCAQDAENPRELMRFLSKYQYAAGHTTTSAAELIHTLAWLAEYELATANNVSKGNHWYAQRDALNPIQQQPALESVANSHAFFATPNGQQSLMTWLMTWLTSRPATCIQSQTHLRDNS